MPFGVPWTDAPRDVLVRESAKHQWRQRCSVEPGNWTGIGVALALVGTLYIIGSRSVWAEVRAFLGSRTQLNVAGWLAVLALALAGASFLTLRRAEP